MRNQVQLLERGVCFRRQRSVQAGSPDGLLSNVVLRHAGQGHLEHDPHRPDRASRRPQRPSRIHCPNDCAPVRAVARDPQRLDVVRHRVPARPMGAGRHRTGHRLAVDEPDRRQRQIPFGEVFEKSADHDPGSHVHTCTALVNANPPKVSQVDQRVRRLDPRVP